jgi:hypothetical protein
MQALCISVLKKRIYNTLSPLIDFFNKPQRISQQTTAHSNREIGDIENSREKF